MSDINIDFTNLINSLKGKFEKLSNKKTVIDDTTTASDTSSYPTVYAIQTWVSGKLTNKLESGDNVSELVNDAGYITEVTEQVQSNWTETDTTKKSYIQNKPTIPDELKDLSDDATHRLVTDAEKTTWNNKSEFSGNYEDLTNKPTIPDELKDLTADSTHRVVTDTQISTWNAKSDFSGSYNDLTNKPDLTDYLVTVEKKATAETGYLATYEVKQDGVKVGSSINIPKDFLVKSASVKTCTTKDQPVSGYEVGDKYIDFIVNTKDGSATDEHLYVLVKDLVDNYTADNVTLQLANNQFKVKDGGISSTQLASAVNTSLGYANVFNTSPCKGITSTQITSWDSIAANGMLESDLQALVDDLADAIDDIT